ncbi:hypothetical protein BATDEDRAFT_16026 [Batrachochytrium dendrobatidis JAM81]|uniref:Piwi domain-containing protein n=2 Tax=Batrachochytrium dendrobatidis TaxID=109871 RepID=F4NYW7_BATDJ|nr:uncharacterized protein BATDEDRAFT_16026 [Batrachochytrium dendrobatidis JAM81]EGF81781.1 hypothetical protein BATDEDRAFT_16026 [Batrachochytrium dendrobatidis JAM81]OAJ40312.1 hypothetical protein BDEG_24061 [Batrachochytrium dendrobatidis JEL423]|eukprot:XP_006677177.1 hypothetical protein BATDEDRAFT_16026 [Batrachochytrium dendrobatidis JAM81]
MSLFPRRPNNGSSGRMIPVRANFFSLTTLPSTVIHHYSVEILPEIPPAKNRRIYKLWEEGSRVHGALKDIFPVYDGRTNIYSSKPLPFEGSSALFHVDYYDEDEFVSNSSAPSVKGPAKVFVMTITKLPPINMQRLSAFLDGLVSDTPHEAINVLDVLLRHRPSLQFTTIGRCFYTPHSATTIANGIQLWQGFHQSLCPTRGQMLLNIDVSATAFYQSGSLVQVVAQLLGKNNASDLKHSIAEKDRNKLEKTLKGIKIITVHRNPVRRKYGIIKFTTTPATRTMFALNNTNAEQNVADYFMTKYSIKLTFPHLPCIVVGTLNRPIYLPLEVCKLFQGQRHLRKLNERQTADMIKFTCQAPHVRSNKISAGFTLLQQRDNDYLADFGVQINHEMVTVSARVLPAPEVSYHPGSKEPLITPQDGAWNLRDKMVAQGVTLRAWCVIVFGTEKDYSTSAIQSFITLMVQTCEECGVFVPNKQPPISYSNPFGDIERALIDAYIIAGESYQERPQLLVCILPNTGVSLYAEIKRVSDTVIGIATQCLQAKHMLAAKRQYCANVCLKINVKLGGMNSYLSSQQLPFVSERPTIILGADLTHPALGSASSQSIAAVVGSMDAQCSRYTSSIRIQNGGRNIEYIQDLTAMMIELLKTFYQTCSAKPERIVFYRDGVSESQFNTVLRYEIDSIRRACAALDPEYHPTVTFIIVQKRHHARFFPIRPEDTDKSGNVLPGTVVDLGVTHPSEFDFYMCSHPGLQGTSKPTHYKVLFDENGFTSDSLQELTYRLCYLYCRATRSVSVVPPAYYAHLVATRARFHATGEDVSNIVKSSNDNVSLLRSGSGGRSVSNRISMTLIRSLSSGKNAMLDATAIPIAKIITYSTVKPELANVMYFM